MNQTFYYGRVSTQEQNLDIQTDRFELLGADPKNIFFRQGLR